MNTHAHAPRIHPPIDRLTLTLTLHLEFKNKHGANDPLYRQLHQLQAHHAGWSQLFQGRLVKEWSILQEAFLDSHNDKLKLDRRYYTGAIWVRKLVSLFWAAMPDCWDHPQRRPSRPNQRRKPQHPPYLRHGTNHRKILRPGPYDVGSRPQHNIQTSQNKTKGRSPAALELWLERNMPIVKLSTKKQPPQLLSRPTYASMITMITTLKTYVLIISMAEILQHYRVMIKLRKSRFFPARAKFV
jgi:hypothetical protein